MTLVDLIKEDRLYDAVILTVGLIEKSAHEKPDIKELIKSYRLCHTKEAEPYLLDMIKTGILKILFDATQTNIQVEELLHLAETISEYGHDITSGDHFEDYLSDFLYQVAQSMYNKENIQDSYRFLSAVAALRAPVRAEYILLENALKRNLQLPNTYSIFMSGGTQGQMLLPPQTLLQMTSCVRKRRFRVDILLEWASAWCKVKSLYDALSKDRFFDCRLVAINMQEFAIDSTTAYPAFLKFLNERDIPFVPEEEYDLVERRPDALIYTNPYDGHHPKFAVEHVRHQGIRVIYLPYSVPFFVQKNNSVTLYDFPIHRHAWQIYVRSQRERRKYGMYCSAGNAHLAVVGAPIVDRLTELKNLIKPDPRFQKTFLWGIDYGFANRTATFGVYGERILQYFIEHPQYGLIVRPHPLFYGMVTKLGGVSKEAIRSFYDYCEAAPNVFLDLGDELTDAFCKSDALISDISSILVEYLSMGRPILYLNTQDTPKYKNYQEDDSDVLAHYYSGDSFERIVQFIEMVAKNEDPMREERDSILEKYFYRPMENAGETIKDLLKDALRNV
jgi:possible TPR repeat-containing protein